MCYRHIPELIAEYEAAGREADAEGRLGSDQSESGQADRIGWLAAWARLTG